MVHANVCPAPLVKLYLVVVDEGVSLRSLPRKPILRVICETAHHEYIYGWWLCVDGNLHVVNGVSTAPVVCCHVYRVLSVRDVDDVTLVREKESFYVSVLKEPFVLIEVVELAEVKEESHVAPHSVIGCAREFPQPLVKVSSLFFIHFFPLYFRF